MSTGTELPAPGLPAAERLAQSRERLRQALNTARGPAVAGNAQNTDASASHWLDRLKSIPGASVVTEAARSWWSQHPFRRTCQDLADATKTILQPVAQRHPLGLVAAAFLVGGVLGWSRPWRWIVTPALVAGLLPQLVAKAASPAWITLLASLARQKTDPNT